MEWVWHDVSCIAPVVQSESLSRLRKVKQTPVRSQDFLLLPFKLLWKFVTSPPFFFFLLEIGPSAVPTCHKSQVSLLWLVRGLSVCTQKHFGWRPSTTPLGNWQRTESFQTNTHFWIGLLMPSWPLYFPTSPFVFLITFLDASKGQQQLRTVLEWQMNVLACRPSGWCANRFQWWPSNKTPSFRELVQQWTWNRDELCQRMRGWLREMPPSRTEEQNN